jgi:hypothetical protein
MQRWIPIAGFGFAERTFDERIFRLHCVARSSIRQIRNLQVNGGNSRQACIIGIQGRCDGRKT